MKQVSVIVPCRNERRYIEAFCEGVLRQQLPEGWQLQLVVADGQSDDGTRELLQRIAASDPRLAWIDNPARIVSTGLNAALKLATGEAIVRMDETTQQNAALVEESAAAAGSLSSQARQLVEAVEVFHLRGGHRTLALPPVAR